MLVSLPKFTLFKSLLPQFISQRRSLVFASFFLPPKPYGFLHSFHFFNGFISGLSFVASPQSTFGSKCWSTSMAWGMLQQWNSFLCCHHAISLSLLLSHQDRSRKQRNARMDHRTRKGWRSSSVITVWSLDLTVTVRHNSAIRKYGLCVLDYFANCRNMATLGFVHLQRVLCAIQRWVIGLQFARVAEGWVVLHCGWSLCQ